MPKGFDAAKFNRDVRAAQRKAQTQLNREIDRANRENKRRVDAYNRKVEQENKKAIDDYNRRAMQQNKKAITDYNNQVTKVNAHNSKVVADLNRELRSSASGPRYTPSEQALADRVQNAVVQQPDRTWDVFLSYARIDGVESALSLRNHLEALGVTVWFDELTIRPGESQSLQMDKGLRDARCGLVLLTPAYLVGRFWTERELGALLRKSTLIPVLDGVTFDQVSEYSGILPDLAGFETSRDSLETIAQKVAAAVLVS